MSHNSSDTGGFHQLETITVPTTGSAPAAVSAPITVSSPATPAPVYVQLPPANSVVSGQGFEIKDGLGLADLNSPIDITVIGGATIDGQSSDIIDAHYGSKTYFSDGTNWYVRGESTAHRGIVSGGGGTLHNFDSATPGDPLPSEWVTSESGTGIPWIVSNATFGASLGNSAAADYNPDTINGNVMPAASVASPAVSSMTWSGTIQSGEVVSWSWLASLYQANNPYSVYNQLKFFVNGIPMNSWLKSNGQAYVWMTDSWTATVSQAYTLEFRWTRTSPYAHTSYLNGCFVDDFMIT